ncbi:uncharacterized protein PG986_013051 [Apiospora aurea]|uniref:Uncharacterized protein n=1 Tax=Apiospora aurea TaxID=335848 RepID=A0ABR1Q1Q3_9PEZI
MQLVRDGLLAVKICLRRPGVNVQRRQADLAAADHEKSKTTETMIGILILLGGRRDPAVFRNTEIAVRIAQGYESQGYDREVIYWSLDWALAYAGMHRVALRSLEERF